MFPSRSQKTLGIVFALQAETVGLRHALAHSKRLRAVGPRQSVWQVGEAKIVADICGVGREQARLSATRLIEQGACWIACAGFAAALDVKARAGDVVVADSVKQGFSGEPAIECNRALMVAIPPNSTQAYTIWRSDLVTFDSAVLRASAKTEIYKATGAAALDMEARAVAEVCQQRQVPLVVVKGISDTADQDLPDEIAMILAAGNWAQRLGIVLARPTIWPDLWRLGKSSRLAANNLGDVLGTMLLRLFA